MRAVTCNGFQLASVPEEHKTPEVVLAAVQQDGKALQFAPIHLRGNRTIVLAAVTNAGQALKHASSNDPNLRDDKDVVLTAVQRDESAYRFASDTMKGDLDVALATVTKNGFALGDFIGHRSAAHLVRDKCVVLRAVTSDGSAIQYVPCDVALDRRIATAAITNESSSAYTPVALKCVVQAWNDCCAQHVNSVPPVEKLHADIDFVSLAVARNGLALEWALPEHRADKSVVLTAVESNGLALKFASKKLKNDKVVVLNAIEQNAVALQHASEELKNDSAVVKRAVQRKGSALQYASLVLKSEPAVVLEAVSNYAMAIEFASDSLKAKRDFILEAVEVNGMALGYVPRGYKADKGVALAAVKHSALAFQYVAYPLTNDTDIVNAAKQCNGNANDDVEAIVRLVKKLYGVGRN